MNLPAMPLPLEALAATLESRSGAVLEAWRALVEADPRLTSASNVSRSQFYDHIPAVLAAFLRELRAHGVSAQARAEASQKQSAGEHGLVRWQQGFGLFEVMLEWRHLHVCLLYELERGLAQEARMDPAHSLFARQALATLCSDGVCESADQYIRLQQVDAAGRVDDLEQALARLNELEQARTAVWREAAHDLRGNLGVVKNAAELLGLPEVPEATRSKSLGILQSSVGALQGLLGDMTSLARLEAGREQRILEDFDAADLLRRLGEDYEGLAAQRGLTLRTDGPASLPVQGDPVKVRRIAQNLVANALQGTERGGVCLSWGEDAAERWFLAVQDSGPGLSASRQAPLARAMREATDEAHEVHEMEPRPPMPYSMPSQGALRSGRPPGEGVGLSIVKRLCEILDAAIELQSPPGKGSTFRISLPRVYSA